uniref:Placental growth factor b n=1 Tax=Oryzias sinensis TaxID=183150 RepID=A0A8C8DUM6_9TELE
KPVTCRKILLVFLLFILTYFNCSFHNQNVFKFFCRTIEKLVEVVQEYPTEVEHIYSPSCVPLVRCAGCCGDENLECHPTSTTNVTMQLLKIRPSESGQEYMPDPSQVTAVMTPPFVAAWLIIYFQPSDNFRVSFNHLSKTMSAARGSNSWDDLLTCCLTDGQGVCDDQVYYRKCVLIG